MTSHGVSYSYHIQTLVEVHILARYRKYQVMPNTQWKKGQVLPQKCYKARPPSLSVHLPLTYKVKSPIFQSQEREFLSPQLKL